MRHLLIYTILVLSLAFLNGCQPVRAAAATLEPEVLVQPDPVPAELAERFQSYQAIFDAASMEQTLFHKYDDILVAFSEATPLRQEITLRIQTTEGRIYGERITWVEAGSVINLGEAYVLPDGDYFVVLMPTPGVYYLDGVRAERRLEIQVRVRQ